MPKNVTMKHYSFAYVLFTAVVFAEMEPLSKLLASSINALTLTFLRFSIASCLLLPYAIIKISKQKLAITPKKYLHFSLQGTLSVAISMGLLQLAVFQSRSPALVAVIFSTNSVITIMLAAIILKEKLTIRRVIAFVLCMCGVALGALGANGESFSTILLTVASAVAMSLFTVIGKRLMNGMPAAVQIGIAFPIGSIVLGAALIITGQFGEVDLGNIRNLAIVLFLGIIVTGLGYLSYFKAMERAGAFMASLVYFIKPVLSPLMTLITIGSVVVSRWFFVTIVLVMIGMTIILLENYRSKKRRGNNG